MVCIAEAGKKANWILARVSPDERERLDAKMKCVLLKKGDMIYRTGGSIDSVFFPLSASASIRCSFVNGTRAEVASVGREGMLGVDAFMSSATSGRDVVVDCPGLAIKMEARDFVEEFERGGLMKSVSLGFVMAHAECACQNSACGRIHSIAQQFAKWVLTALDRNGGAEILDTHDEVAVALGVRRESITACACAMRSQGAIDYKRGCLTVLDRSLLEKHACECYEAGKTLAWRHLGRFKD
jgi:CRP-like cAMP-binding protein